jgi:hydroxymethylbilane synthase
VPVGGTLGTGSKRRIGQLKAIRPDLNFVPVRGNIETRMDKIVRENLDGVVLAAAGLHRLGLEERITVYLEPQTCMPAPAQGALAIEYRKGDFLVEGLLKGFEDETSHVTAMAERAFLEAVGGSCHVPIGAYARVKGQTLKLDALFGNETDETLHKWQGEISINDETRVESARQLGENAAKAVLEAMRGAL